MARIDDLLATLLGNLELKPDDNAPQSSKKRYSERISENVAIALASELRHRGLKEARPFDASDGVGGGAERRMAGGLGAKKVDVTWATEESGLLCAASIKTINFRDKKTKNFQKNLTNRRGDMLMEAVTLHRRFPYAVLVGLFFFDKEASGDATRKRGSTFRNAHNRLQLFAGRNDPSGREDQFELFYLISLDVSPKQVVLRAYPVGQPDVEVSFDNIIEAMLDLVAQRNPDFYEVQDGQLQRAT